MPFRDNIETIPWAPTTAQGRGFLPPIFRAASHVTYLLARHIEGAQIEEAEYLSELKEAKTHWDARNSVKSISTATIAIADRISLALENCLVEIPEWDKETKTKNLRDLVNRIAAFTAHLDREFTGARDSDPGSHL
jgi:hypothetical protein